MHASHADNKHIRIRRCSRHVSFECRTCESNRMHPFTHLDVGCSPLLAQEVLVPGLAVSSAANRCRGEPWLLQGASIMVLHVCRIRASEPHQAWWRGRADACTHPMQAPQQTYPACSMHATSLQDRYGTELGACHPRTRAQKATYCAFRWSWYAAMRCAALPDGGKVRGCCSCCEALLTAPGLGARELWSLGACIGQEQAFERSGVSLPSVSLRQAVPAQANSQG